MTSFFKTITAVCLVASSGLQSVAGGEPTYKWTAEDVTADACLSVNLARNGKLPVHINDVAADAELASSLKDILGDGEAQTETTCEALIREKEELLSAKHVFYHVIDSEGERDYRQMLQASLNAGLEVFKTKEYPKTEDGWKTVWGNKAGANLAYLLSSNSTTVGCVIGKCTKEAGPEGKAGRNGVTTVEMTLLICDLDPPATKDQAPFDEEYFTGLIARTAKLADMTADDLKASNDAIAAAVFPTIISASLLAMLTAAWA
ncbi:SAG family member [Eimeria brunetti]|uniref:SAG family member n=1 Tax=Eimeria brunetti TaxID=51314 RepID=U6L5D0_9EIME|nr:SAG family member [Eimeria brunetti]